MLRISAAAAAAPGQSQSQSCEILTVGGREPQLWRPAPVAVAAYRSKAVARGVAHFLLLPHHHGATECDAVASFDLGAEAWKPRRSGRRRRCGREEESAIAAANGG